MPKLKFLKNINNDFKIGIITVSSFALWGLVWFIYSRMIRGSFSMPYLPQFNLMDELKSPHIGSCLAARCYILGTDVHGRSIVELVSSGLLYSLGVSLTVSFCSAILGIIVGYYTVNGTMFVNKAFELIMNIVFIMPNILIAILFMSVIGQSILGLIFTLSFTGWPSFARITRNEILRVMGLSYVEGAKAIGMSKLKIFTSAIFPAILPFLLIQFILGLSSVIISESTLGFLGLGSSEYSWGELLLMGKTVLLEAPHVTFVLSLTMASLIIGLNLLGDGLRDYLDPHINN